jgi:hypothetical protein
VIGIGRIDLLRSTRVDFNGFVFVADQFVLDSHEVAVALGTKMISASPIAGCPSFKFLTMQMQPSASCARM